MSFSVYRKHQKTLLLLATVVCVVVFVLFPSFGDVTSALEGRGAAGDVVGRFTDVVSGDVVEITQGEYDRTAQRLASFYGNRSNLTEDQVWQHLMLVADARAAGLWVADEELVHELKSQAPGLTSKDYANVWRRMNFPSARTFEEFFKERILVDRWVDTLAREAGIVDADEVYTRWRVDHELFDMQALVFDDADPATIADPGDEVLSAYFDETPQYLRERRYADPARYDIAYAWLPLDAELASLPADKLATLPEVTDADAELRFNQVRAQRFPDAESASPETLELLRHELMVSNLVSEAHRAWIASKDDAVGPTPEGPEGEDEAENPFAKQAFVQFLSGFGMQIGDPQGLLGPDELESLDEIGSPTLAAQLTSMTVGQTRYFRPFGDDNVAEIVFVEALQDAVPLGFDEAREKVLDQWRQEDAQRAAAAKAFRAALTAAARGLPEAQELIAPIEADAMAAAEARIAAAAAAAAASEEPDTASVDADAIRAEELATVAQAVDLRLAEFEARFWDEQVAAAQAAGGEDVRVVTLSDVSKAYRLAPDGDEAADSVERFLKINTQVQVQAVDGITQVLRHTAGKASAVVRVTGRRFPPIADMLADTEGFEQARKRASQSKSFGFQMSFGSEALMGPRTADNPNGHDLARIQRKAPEVAAPEGDS